MSPWFGGLEDLNDSRESFNMKVSNKQTVADVVG